MAGVEVRTGDVKAYSNRDGIASFHNLTSGVHEFDAYFNWFKSCGSVALDVKGDNIASATVTMRLVPGQGWVNQNGKSVTPTPEDLAAQAAEDSIPCPEVTKSR
jgi:hypothetical protein